MEDENVGVREVQNDTQPADAESKKDDSVANNVEKNLKDGLGLEESEESTESETSSSEEENGGGDATKKNPVPTKQGEASGDDEENISDADKDPKNTIKDENKKTMDKKDSDLCKFNCKVCSVLCSSQYDYDCHMKGNRHKKNKEDNKKDKSAKNQNKAKKQTAGKNSKIRLQLILDVCKEPLIGLEHVTEFQKDDKTRYECGLCECKCHSKQILPHCLGLKHRLKYMEKNFDEYYKEITEQEKPEQQKAATDIARKIEQTKGRKQMRYKIERDPVKQQGRQNNMGNQYQRNHNYGRPGGAMGQNFNNQQAFFEHAFNFMGQQASYGGNQAHAQAAGLVPNPFCLTECLRRTLEVLQYKSIQTEREARLAIEVTRNLTEAVMDASLNTPNDSYGELMYRNLNEVFSNMRMSSHYQDGGNYDDQWYQQEGYGGMREMSGEGYAGQGYGGQQGFGNQGRPSMGRGIAGMMNSGGASGYGAMQQRQMPHHSQNKQMTYTDFANQNRQMGGAGMMGRGRGQMGRGVVSAVGGSSQFGRGTGSSLLGSHPSQIARGRGRGMF